ncbi:hypothetical protein AB0B79_30430 [Streptomyces sp. NPDC039022]|uniref:hypothetical protein n=1 Tax=Streptomyces sp. NPDC039022 TaxID=3157091 RepID=UPI0033F8B66F
MPELLAAAALLAAGYALGRVRPWDRLDAWVWRRFVLGGPWTHTRRGQLVTLAAHALVRPAATVRAWRHRHDPPPGRAAPVCFRTPDVSD